MNYDTHTRCLWIGSESEPYMLSKDMWDMWVCQLAVYRLIDRNVSLIGMSDLIFIVSNFLYYYYTLILNKLTLS